MRIVVDTGGTFTDLVIEDDNGSLSLFKAPTTPANPVDGVLDVLRLAGDALGLGIGGLLTMTHLFVHGTTVATNAVVTGKTARTAFLTTAGHPDILVLREGGRIGLPLFDYSTPYPKPYIPRALTFEIPERIGPDGTVLTALDEAACDDVIARLGATDVQAVAVCLLWSIVNPAHEQRLEALLGKHLPDLSVSLSHRVNPSLREYRRASSTAIDASLKPIMAAYAGELEQSLRDAGFAGRALFVTSQGMTRDFADVAASPIHTVKSGPAMAPVAGRHYAGLDGGASMAIITDTGGTTYDVALVRHGLIPESRETWIGRPFIGHMTGFPSIDITSVGAGGGSIAWVDRGGLLHIGPDSAGADPGPACYGLGGVRATVSDAAVVLGFIDPDFFLGGTMALDPALAHRALERDVGGPLSLPVDQAALAIFALTNETMAGAIEDITVNQGLDPRDAVLVGGGGAAGLNSVAIARRLGCRRVVFPDAGAVLSAVGGLLSPLSDDMAAFFPASSVDFDQAGVNTVLDQLTTRAQAFAARSAMPTAATTPAITYAVEARYGQQIWEIKLPLPVTRFTSDDDVARLCQAFHALHREVFAFEDPGAEIEFVNWRVAVACDLRQGALGRLVERSGEAAQTHQRQVVFAGPSELTVPVHRFETLASDQVFNGPVIIETPFTSIVVDPGATFRHAPSGSLVVELELLP